MRINWKKIKIVSMLFLLATIIVYSCKKKEELRRDDENSKPLISSYYPNSGNSGTLVTIEGEHFSTDLSQFRASIGTIEAEVISATNKKVVLRTPKDGKSGALRLFINNEEYAVGEYAYQELTISKVFPDKGPVGSQIQISGAGFGSPESPAIVKVNGKGALVLSASDSLLVAEIPNQAGVGPVTVEVNGKITKGQNFRYQEFTDIKPRSGGKGTKVIITGIGFNPDIAGNTVDFNGKVAKILELNEGQLIVQAPEGVETGPISVTIDDTKLTGPEFKVVPLPIIRTVSPLSAPEGSEVTITGENYSAIEGEVIVLINGKKANVVKSTERTINVKVPQGTGLGRIQVFVNDQLTEGPEFKEQNLGILGVFPESGLAGDIISIKGLGFSKQLGENKVSFNGLAGRIQSATDSELKVLLPEGLSSGELKIEVSGLTAKWPNFLRAGIQTLAGGPNSSTFSGELSAIAIDSKGNIYVSDVFKILKISPSGSVTNYAGSDERGTKDGPKENARFSVISDMQFDQDDNLFIADLFNNTIRKITPAGDVSTVSIKLTNSPVSMSIDRLRNFYLGYSYNRGMAKLNLLTKEVSPVPGGNGGSVESLAAVSPSEIYSGDSDSDYPFIYKLENGVKRIIVGSGEKKIIDGTGIKAGISSLKSLFYSKDNILYFIDNGNVLRKFENGEVKSLLGLQNGNPVSGYQDGNLSNAKLNGAGRMCMDKDGILYIVDKMNKAVRKVYVK